MEFDLSEVEEIEEAELIPGNDPSHFDEEEILDSVNHDLVNHDDELITHVVTVDEMFHIGLMVGGYTEKQVKRCGKKTNQYWFKITYGVSPKTMCTMYEDIQTSDAQDKTKNPPRLMRLKGSKTNLKWFLRTVYYMRNYPTEEQMVRSLDVNQGWARDRIWDIMEMIQHLKYKKITWPNDLGGDDIWILTVDGTHVWLYEPGHPEFSQDSEYYSHKFNKAGINYELGIAIATGKLVWMNGPYKAGNNDLKIFTRCGLKEKLLELMKKAIGDRGYAGHHEVISIPNRKDSRKVKLFKSRALKRHETFNGMTKTFGILRERF